MAHPEASSSKEPTQNLSRFEAVFKGFEQAWKSGTPPQLEDYVPADADASGRRAVLVELVHIDMEFRLKAGEAVRVESYVERYPELGAGRDTMLSLMVAEHDLRKRFAPGATGPNYKERFPAIYSELAELLTQREGSGEKKPAAPQATVPTTVPGYEVLEELGRGGMGVVYKARQKSLKRLVALKMILPGRYAGRDELARFRAEADAVAHLQHPNVVQIYDVGEQDGQPYFALELVDSGSLSRKLGGRPQPPGEAALLVETVARAMHYCHQRGIIHRDLKPANVLLTTEGTPKVTDFGLAKQLEGDLGQTQTGAVLGTPCYMAPEQAAGKTREIGPLTDVYALGAILYEVLTGVPPFRAGTLVETLEQVRFRDPVHPSRLQPRIPRDLETICLKCLAKEPARRYASALALAQDLERLRLGESILARPEGPAGRLWRKVRRNPVLCGAVLAVTLALSTAGVVFVVSGEARDKAREDRLIAAANQTIDAGPANGEWTTAHLQKMDATIAELAQLAGPAEADAARDRCHKQFRQAVSAMIAAPKLEGKQLAHIEQTLELLAGRDPHAAQELRSTLKNRVHAWETVFALPGEPVAGVFAPGVGVAQIGNLFARVAPPTDPDLKDRANLMVLSSVPAAKNSRLEAVFDDGWEKAAEVGLLLNASRAHSQWIWCLGFSGDGRTLVSASGDDNQPGEVILWDALRRQQRGSYRPGKPGILSASFAPDGTRLAVGCSKDARVTFLDPASGRVLGGFAADPTGVAWLAYSPDGKLLATGTGVADKSGEVSLWDPATGEKRGTLGGFKHIVARLTFSPDGRLLAAGSYERIIKVWEVATRKLRLSTVPMHLDFVSCGRFSADSRLFAAPAHTDEAQRGKLVADALLWDTTTGAEDHFRPAAHTGGMSALAFAPGGRQFAAATAWGRAIYLHEEPNGRWRKIFYEGPAPGGRMFSALEFSPDGATLVAAADDKSLKVYDIPGGQLRGAFAEGSYAFVLRSSGPVAAKDMPDKAPPTLQALRVAGSPFRLQVLRNGVVLREQQELPARIPSGELRLTATRSGSRLSLQVNDLPPLVFEEALSLGGDAGAFGVQWPAQARIKEIRASRLALPAKASPLERGDYLLAREQYTEALAQYQEQAQAAGAGPVSQEARFKAAHCLRLLRRDEESDELCEHVAAEEGERWPIAAGVDLLTQRVHQGRLADADTVFETLAKRHGYDQLASRCPQDAIDRLVQAYVGDIEGLNLFLARGDAETVRKLERARAIQDAFRVAPPARVPVQVAFVRAAQLAGRLDDAVGVAEELVNNGQYWPGIIDRLGRASVVEQYSWLLRQRGQAAKALVKLNEELFEKPGTYRPESLVLLVERARVYAALGRWQEAEKDLDVFILVAPSWLGNYPSFARAQLLRGFLRARRGDEAGAVAAWREGTFESFVRQGKGDIPGLAGKPLSQAPGVWLFDGVILASLAGELTDTEARAILTRLLGAIGGGGPVSLVQKGVLQLPPGVMREMCRTVKGREAARRMAFQDIAYAEYVRTPGLLFLAETLHQEALPGALTPDQGTILWEVAEKLHAAYAANKLATAQFFQLGLTWKGTTNFLGWAGIAPVLEPSLRGPLAYVMGHRYLRLGQPKDAETLFRTAAKDAPAGSALARLAQGVLEAGTGK